MIQFNLLPDVKLEYIKARRTKNMVVVSSIVVGGSALAVLILLFTGVSVLQKKHMNDLTKDIKTYTKQLENTPDLNKALTVQNQLKSLETLHQKKPITTRLFGYLNQITPSSITISAVSLDIEKQTLGLTGNATDLTSINKFVDTIKFTNMKVDNNQNQKAFTEVVLSSYTVAQAGGKATYQVSFKFDPVIFDGTKQVALEVPKQTSTRSETEKPKLFEEKPQEGLPTGSQ